MWWGKDTSSELVGVSSRALGKAIAAWIEDLPESDRRQILQKLRDTFDPEPTAADENGPRQVRFHTRVPQPGSRLKLIAVCTTSPCSCGESRPGKCHFCEATVFPCFPAALEATAVLACEECAAQRGYKLDRSASHPPRSHN